MRLKVVTILRASIVATAVLVGAVGCTDSPSASAPSSSPHAVHGPRVSATRPAPGWLRHCDCPRPLLKFPRADLGLGSPQDPGGRPMGPPRHVDVFCWGIPESPTCFDLK